MIYWDIFFSRCGEHIVTSNLNGFFESPIPAVIWRFDHLLNIPLKVGPPPTANRKDNPLVIAAILTSASSALGPLNEDPLRWSSFNLYAQAALPFSTFSDERGDSVVFQEFKRRTKSAQ